MDVILVINAGSSSIKFAAYAADAKLSLIFKGSINEIGNKPHLQIKNASGQVIHEEQFKKNLSYTGLFNSLFDWIEAEKEKRNFNLVAIGHRIVHGGVSYYLPTILNATIIKKLKKLIPFAPLHQPENLQAVELLAKRYPKLTQVACFDTAFHVTNSKIAKMFALPKEYYDQGIRRYGFHGLSYEYILHHLKQTHPHEAEKKIIVAHLGNGASLCAIHKAKSIDTTMGFSALDGLMMGTRSGSIDPGVILYLSQYKHMNAKKIQELLYKKSGLLGVSGISNDVRTLIKSNSEYAKLALQLFVYRIQQEIGALSAVLQGLDHLIFTAGIGENSAFIRAAVLEGLEWLGLAFDQQKNLQNHTLISSHKSRIKVHVIPTNEEYMIAYHTYRLLY